MKRVLKTYSALFVPSPSLTVLLSVNKPTKFYKPTPNTPKNKPRNESC